MAQFGPAAKPATVTKAPPSGGAGCALFDVPDGHFAVGNSERDAGTRLRVVREVDGGVAYLDLLDAASIKAFDNTSGGPFELESGFPDAWMERAGYIAARRPADAELGALYSNGLVFAHENGAPFFGEARVAKNCAAAGEAFPSTRSSSPSTIEACVDKAIGAKVRTPVAVAAKAAGAETGHDRGGSLSGVVGILAASSAVTGIAAGVISQAVAFGFFVVLVGGLSLVMASVRGA